MTSLLIAVGIFFASVFIHAVVYRAVVRTPKTISVFLAGFGVLGSVWWRLPFPLTTMSLYGALVAAYLLYFLSYVNDAQSPSAKVLDVIRGHGPLTYASILAHFTDEELIGMRLARLIRSGWIVKKDGRVRVMGRGALIAGLFTWYRALLGWDSGG